MIRPDVREPAPPPDGLSRREFLGAGSLACLGLGLPGVGAAVAGAPVTAGRGRDVSCILLILVGGPSQLDTWDMKPDAPEGVRGPFRPVQTRVPGVFVSELFPGLARVTDRVSLVRTLHHTAAAVHDTGHQLMQTGRLFPAGVEHPHFGAVAAKLLGPRGDAPANVLLPGPIGPTGGNLPHGQTAGYLGPAFDPVLPGLNFDRRRSGPVDDALDLRREPKEVRERYGSTRFGRACLASRRLVERGTRFVTVNMFQTVFNETTWDVHGSAPFSPIDCYRTEVGPDFDCAYTALIDDLTRTGLLGSTMVLAFGEFGRTPRVNPAGGRDHHPGCWTGLFAGGPLQGGRVVGESDGTASAPRDRPVTPAEVAATVYQGLGLSLDTELPGPDGRPLRLVDPGVEPVHELF